MRRLAAASLLSLIALASASGSMPAIAQTMDPCVDPRLSASSFDTDAQRAASMDAAAAQIEAMALQLDVMSRELGFSLNILRARAAAAQASYSLDALCAGAAADPRCATWKAGRAVGDMTREALNGDAVGVGVSGAANAGALGRLGGGIGSGVQATAAAGQLARAVQNGSDGDVEKALVSTLKASANLAESMADEYSPGLKTIGSRINAASGLLSAGLDMSRNAQGLQQSTDIVATEQQRAGVEAGKMRQRAASLRDKAKELRWRAERGAFGSGGCSKMVASQTATANPLFDLPGVTRTRKTAPDDVFASPGGAQRTAGPTSDPFRMPANAGASRKTADQWKVEVGVVPNGVSRLGDPLNLDKERQRLQAANDQLVAAQLTREAEERLAAQRAAEEAEARRLAEIQRREIEAGLARAERSAPVYSGGGSRATVGDFFGAALSAYLGYQGMKNSGVGGSSRGSGLSSAQCQQLLEQIREAEDIRRESAQYAGVSDAHRQNVQMMDMTIRSNRDMYNQQCR